MQKKHKNLSNYHLNTVCLELTKKNNNNLICIKKQTHERLLRAELHNLRKKGALKTSGSLDRPIIVESNRSCARCRMELGRIINRGAPCRACRLRVCKGCREFSNRTTDWICVVCHKQM